MKPRTRKHREPDAEHKYIAELQSRSENKGNRNLWVWRPTDQLALSPSSLNNPGIENAVEIAEGEGYPSVERTTGGGPVLHTGGNIAFCYTEPLGNGEIDVRDRYRDVTDSLSAALASLDISVSCGETEGEFCPGQYSLKSDGKIAGVAQRVRRGSALTSGVVVVELDDELINLTKLIYNELDMDFYPEALDSVSNYSDFGMDGFLEAIFRELRDELVVDFAVLEDAKHTST